MLVRVAELRLGTADLRTFDSDRKARQCWIGEHNRKIRGFTCEYRFDLAGTDRQPQQIAKRVQHGDATHAGQQKGQQVAKRQAVVDRSDQQQHENERKKIAGARRQDENAPLNEDYRGLLREACAENPIGDALTDVERETG